MQPSRSTSTPIVRVLVMGEEHAQVPLRALLEAREDQSRWSYVDVDFLRDEGPLVCLESPRARLLVSFPDVLARRSALAAFDPDVVVLAVRRLRPAEVGFPARLYGRRVLPNAAPVLWLGGGVRVRDEEKTARAALRAFGLVSTRDAAEITAIRQEDDPHADALLRALEGATAHHPDALAGFVRDDDDPHFRCRSCGARVTFGLRRVRAAYERAQNHAHTRYGQQMFPRAGVYALTDGGEAWSGAQPPPGGPPFDIALIDPRDLLSPRHVSRSGRQGCCGMVPVPGEASLHCACGAALGYLWTECVFWTVAALRLDSTRLVRRRGSSLNDAGAARP